MSYSTEPLREHPSAYIVQDRSSYEEMTRLEIQDKMATKGMGGALSELADHSRLCGVLDVGCGTGGWLIETAKTYPHIKKLVGVDISCKMLEYARAQAEMQQLNGRVQFQTMDALRTLEFRPESFDLVNQRLGNSWLRTWEWKKILLEYHRVTRGGGIIRITEWNGFESNSPALTQLNEIGLMAFYHSGRLFAQRNDGATCGLAPLMTQYGIKDVQTKLHELVCQAGTENGHYFYEDMARMFHVLLPFFQKWTRVPSNYQQIYQQAKQEMQQPDFVATWTLLTAWGTKPVCGAPFLMRGLQ